MRAAQKKTMAAEAATAKRIFVFSERETDKRSALVCTHRTDEHGQL